MAFLYQVLEQCFVLCFFLNFTKWYNPFSFKFHFSFSFQLLSSTTFPLWIRLTTAAYPNLPWSNYGTYISKNSIQTFFKKYCHQAHFCLLSDAACLSIFYLCLHSHRLLILFMRILIQAKNKSFYLIARGSEDAGLWEYKIKQIIDYKE